MDELYYKREHRVLMRDCDRFKRLKPSAMLTMFQDGSETLTEGWGVGLGAMMARGAIWVAAKMEYAVTRLPRHEEDIVIRSWAGRCRAGIYPFQNRIEDAAGNELVRGVSLWVLSDMEARSMISGNVPRITLPTPEPEGTHLPRIPAIHPPEACEHSPRRVMFSETDINGHLTNTRYLDWMTDLVSPDFHRAHPMRGLRVEYRGEIGPEEEVVLDWAVSDERLYCGCKGRFAAELLF